jgi:hypothetical protein
MHFPKKKKNLVIRACLVNEKGGSTKPARCCGSCAKGKKRSNQVSSQWRCSVRSSARRRALPRKHPYCCCSAVTQRQYSKLEEIDRIESNQQEARCPWPWVARAPWPTVHACPPARAGLLARLPSPSPDGSPASCSREGIHAMSRRCRAYPHPSRSKHTHTHTMATHHHRFDTSSPWIGGSFEATAL